MSFAKYFIAFTIGAVVSTLFHAALVAYPWLQPALIEAKVIIILKIIGYYEEIKKVVIFYTIMVYAAIFKFILKMALAASKLVAGHFAGAM